MLEYWILGSAYGFAAAVQPGPLQTYLVNQTLTLGWRRALPAAFAPLLSDAPIATLVMTVLSQVPASMERGLRIAGALFLLYMAMGALKSWRHFSPLEVNPGEVARMNVLKAVTVNLLNPSAYLGWSLVMGPLLLRGWRDSPGHGLSLVIGFYTVLIGGQVAIMGLFALTRRLGPRLNRGLVAASAVALALFGLYQLWLGLLPLRPGRL